LSVQDICSSINNFIICSVHLNKLNIGTTFGPVPAALSLGKKDIEGVQIIALSLTILL
jgi:hypothetical protein